MQLFAKQRLTKINGIIFKFFERYRNLCAAVFIFIAAFLFFGTQICGGLLECGNFFQISVQPVDLATSPAVHNLAEGLEQRKNAENIVAGALSLPMKNTAAAVTVDSSNLIVIPKILIIAPIIAADTLNKDSLYNLLSSGAVLYPQSADFGTAGQTILLGHSSLYDSAKNKNYSIFSRLNELSAGDQILVFYDGKIYQYNVSRSQVIDRGGAFNPSNANVNSLILITCWPPGEDDRRYLVEASFAKTLR